MPEISVSPAARLTSMKLKGAISGPEQATTMQAVVAMATINVDLMRPIHSIEGCSPFFLSVRRNTVKIAR